MIDKLLEDSRSFFTLIKNVKNKTCIHIIIIERKECGNILTFYVHWSIISKISLYAIGGGGIGKKDYCLLCHGVVETGFIIYSSLPNSYEETTNGSFRLSNGVIVLASNDIIKYMNGELVI